MADLSVKYMGLELKTPVVVGACSLSKRLETIKAIEAAGAGAVVIKSLFQEQMELEQQAFEDALNVGADRFPEALRYFPPIEHAGPREHLMWVEEARKAVRMPLIASLNATKPGVWVDYARRLEETGVDALELNLYSVETDPNKTSTDVEQQMCEVIGEVKAQVKVPVAVKLSPYYTATANVAQRAVLAGADALTLFNRFYQPNIDVEKETLAVTLDYSSPAETRLPLRWIAILSAILGGADLAASGGVHTPDDVARHLLAGATVTQVVSALYVNGVEWITTLNEGLATWMDTHGYGAISDFRGKLNQARVRDPHAFERAQYIKLLLGQD